MEDTKVFTQEQKTESLRKAFIGAGYDMASSQAESMEEDVESWGEHMIDGRLILNVSTSVTKRATHSTTTNWIFGLNQMRIFSLKVAVNGDLTNSLRIMVFQMMKYLTFCIKAQTIT